MRPLLFLLLLLPALRVSANGVSSVSPNLADPGVTLTVTMTLDELASPAPPPAMVQPVSMTLGGIAGTSISRTGYDCSATFTIPANQAAGTLDCVITFGPPRDQPELGQVVMSLPNGFTVNSNGEVLITKGPVDRNAALGGSVTFNVVASGDAPLTYQWQDDGVDIIGANAATYTIANASMDDASEYRCVVSNALSPLGVASTYGSLRVYDISDPLAYPYTIVDTAQVLAYDNSDDIATPSSGEDFHGQDANYTGNEPTYITSDDGLTVYDYHTGLTWTQTPDLNGDGVIDVDDKLTQAEAAVYVATLNTESFGGYDDWRLPSIKEIYSLMDFRGTDPTSDDTSSLVPFIDTTYFDFGYGDTVAGERVIDAQMATTSIYVDTVMSGQTAMFGLNLADGRIKGYGLNNIDFYVFYVRGNTDYGDNDFEDNGDMTVTDRATGLMWQKTDSGVGMLWENALSYAEASTHAGYDDWRLPNAKELHSLMDYTRSPGTTSSPAIDAVFTSTQITNEAGQDDYPWYYTGTTHANQNGAGGAAVYFCFGRSTGYMDGSWLDVHGAGAQRSDSKNYDTTGYIQQGTGWYLELSPQGDATRWYNYVRLVRDAPDESPSVDLTTIDASVAFDQKTVSISGNHNEHVSVISWSNALTGGSGMVYATGTSFSINSIPLDMGENVITVTVASSDGVEAEASVTITRSHTFDGSLIYVDRDTPASAANQNGRSWDTAFASLQDALAVTGEGQSIYVAEGTYYPDEAAAGYASVTNDVRSSTFLLPPYVALYGGYNGYGTNNPDRRDSDSILSGDLDQDDVLGEGLVVEDPANNTKNNNSYSVVTALDISTSEPSVLDGFYITAGRADEYVLNETGQGAGVYAIGAKGLSLNDVYFRGNFARTYGGGAYWYNCGSQVFTNCSFIANQGNGRGGSIYVEFSTPDFEDCQFEENRSSLGGAIYIADADVELYRCSLKGNNGEGGAAVNVSTGGTLNSYSCLFTGNYAIDGGAMTINGSALLQNCTLSGNLADQEGGAVYARSGSSVAVVNSIIAYNQNVTGLDTPTASFENGGATVATFEHSLIRGSGGSAAWDSSIGTDLGGNLDEDPQFIDAIIPTGETTSGDYRILASSPAKDVGDNASVSGSFDVDGSSRIVNTTVDLGAFEENLGVALPVLTITNGESRVVTEDGQVDVTGTANDQTTGDIAWENETTGESGLFASVATWSLADVPFQEGSNTVTFTGYNVYGNEASASMTIISVGDVVFVDVASPAALVDQDGTTWETAYVDPQDAFDVMGFGASVWIAEGTYIPATGESFEIGVEDGLVLGGFESGMSDAASRDHESYPVIFDGDGETRLIVSLTSEAMIFDGIQLTNAVASSSVTTVGMLVGSGIETLQVNNCSFTGFTSSGNADLEGLAMKIVGVSTDGFVDITSCSFTNNHTGIDGGAEGLGLYVKDIKELNLLNTDFDDNTKGDRYGEVYGAALYLGSIETVTIIGCDFTDNGGVPYQGRARGGAVAFEGATTATVSDCLFEGNFLESSRSDADYGGAAVCVKNNNADVTFERCKFVGNYFFDPEDSRGGAAYCYSGYSTFTNCLFYDNAAENGGAIYIRGNRGTLSNCTIVENTATGSGGGVLLNGGGLIENSIVYGNSATNSVSVAIFESGSVINSCMDSLLSGNGNIAASPMFVDAANDDFQIDLSSPCVNTGANAIWMDGVTDLGGSARVYAQRVDMGAYEASGPGISDVDTDGDDIGDFDEMVIYGSNATLADSDYDGMDDGDELVAGTDLVDASSLLQLSITSVEEGALQLEWPSVDGRTYTLRGTDDLSEPQEDWDDLGDYNATVPRNSTEVSPETMAYFFRLEVEEAPVENH